MLTHITSRAKSAKHRFDAKFKTLTMCKKCYSFYYRSVWHFEAPRFIRDEAAQEVPLRLTQCPACTELELAIEERDIDFVPQGAFS